MDVLWAFPAAAGLMVLVGVFGLVHGVRRTRSWNQFVRTARDAEAEVVDLRRVVVRTHDRRSVSWVPVVRFALPDGQVVTGEAMYSGTTRAAFTPGAWVPVRYDPTQPSRVALRSVANGRTMGCLQAGIGVGLVLVGSVALVASIALVRALP